METNLAERLRACEAGAAVMREAMLEVAKAVSTYGPLWHGSSEIQQLHTALALDAGRELLEEVDGLRDDYASLMESSKTADEILSHQISTIAAERDSLRRKVAAAEGMARTLESAGNGLKWFVANHPEGACQGDEEMRTEIESALAAWQEANK